MPTLKETMAENKAKKLTAEKGRGRSEKANASRTPSSASTSALYETKSLTPRPLAPQIPTGSVSSPSAKSLNQYLADRRIPSSHSGRPSSDAGSRMSGMSSDSVAQMLGDLNLTRTELQSIKEENRSLKRDNTEIKAMLAEILAGIKK